MRHEFLDRPAVGRAAIFIILALLFASRAPAQTTGIVAGAIGDASGGALSGVTVTVRNVDTSLVRTVVSDEDGRFVVAGIPVGRYEVRAELSGFKPLVRKDIALVVGQTAVVALTMQVGGVDEEITVSGQASAINTRSAELSYLVSAETIEQLPLNGRNYTDLLLLQPGVNAFPHRDGGSAVAHGLAMSVNGQDPRSNVYLLDGTLQNDFTNGPAGSAAGTALGMETVREFRVESNAYSAEFGRNMGGQVNVLTKSGTNDFRGSAFEFHRNDAFDARNYFDTAGKPDFWRNQYGGTVGGPIRADRLFFFAGYEGLREHLGKTISTFVPDDDARLGILPDPARPGQTINIGVNPAVAPFLNEYPRANGARLGDGIALYTYPFQQKLNQDFLQGRIDYQMSRSQQIFARYTLDDADQYLPTDYPQFPRTFLSRNQFFTAEHRHIWSASLLNTLRLGFSRTRIGQNVEAHLGSPLAPFIQTRPSMGAIDVGGLNRFGPQSSANLRLVQNVFSLQQDLVNTRGRHLLKAGSLFEHYQDNMVNPTFSLGIYNFPSLTAFLQNRPQTFVGLTPEAQFDRYWRFWLFGFYLQDEIRATPRLTLNGGLRYEFTTLPQETYGRDVALINLTDTVPTVGKLYENPTYGNLSPRVGAAWDVFGNGRTAVRGGYGLYFNTNNQQNLIVTVTNPPFTPRPVIANPTFPNPPFDRPTINSIRPIQFDLENPRVHVWNVSVQRDLFYDVMLTLGYAGSRGKHLLRSNDVNTAVPTIRADGTPLFAAGAPRINPAFTTIELKSSDGDSWYKALIVELRRRWKQGFAMQSSYTLSKSEDTTQASTFFSDATNGTTTAFPEFIPDYNKGLSDFHAKHTWVLNFTWAVPFGRSRQGAAGAVLGGWQVSGIWTMRSGNPLTVFVQGNRSRSQWNPSLGPGIGRDRPSYAPGRGPDDAVRGVPTQWFDPSAFALQEPGTFGNTRRGDFIGPNLRTFDMALVKTMGLPRSGTDRRLEVRLEAFNLFNRANFGPPALTAFTGTAPTEQPVATFGRIRSTITSARQIQIGARLVF